MVNETLGAVDYALEPASVARGEGSLQEVAAGVLAWVQPDGSWWINNAGVVYGTNDVVLIDTCATERRTRRLLAAVADATGDLPIRVAVNTHEHGDHTHGNSLLPASTVLVAHEATRAELLADGTIDECPPLWSPVPDWGKVVMRVPTMTVRSDLTLHHADRRIELRHPGYPAHSAGDLVAWLPDQGILFTGDLIFHRLTPLVISGSLEGALRSLEWLASFEPAQVVPGHGPLVDAAALPEVLATHERYYRLVVDTARAGLRDGLTPLQAARRCDLAEFADLPDGERLVLNLHRAYADAAGAKLDFEHAFADAVSLAGRPMHCAA